MTLRSLIWIGFLNCWFLTFDSSIKVIIRFWLNPSLNNTLIRSIMSMMLSSSSPCTFHILEIASSASSKYELLGWEISVTTEVMMLFYQILRKIRRALNTPVLEILIANINNWTKSPECFHCRPFDCAFTWCYIKKVFSNSVEVLHKNWLIRFCHYCKHFYSLRLS